MSEKFFHVLYNQDLMLGAALCGTTKALHHFLSERPEVLEIREKILNGEIIEDQIQKFTFNIIDKIHPGLGLDDVPLSAMAVAMEKVNTEFTLDYLLELSKVRFRELFWSPKIAKAVLGNRL